MSDKYKLLQEVIGAKKLCEIANAAEKIVDSMEEQGYSVTDCALIFAVGWASSNITSECPRNLSFGVMKTIYEGLEAQFEHFKKIDA